jgi:hypothetical protein
MLNFKKIKDKTIVKVSAQHFSCRILLRPTKYDWSHDCRVWNKPSWYVGRYW